MASLYTQGVQLGTLAGPPTPQASGPPTPGKQKVGSPKTLASVALRVDKGRVSWFFGPNDRGTGSTANGTRDLNAEGCSRHMPVGPATLNHWWYLVEDKTGKGNLLQQIDDGPAVWTGRTWDITSGALHLWNYNEGNFPTDSTFTGYDLGPNRTVALQKLAAAGIQGTSGTGGPTDTLANVETALGGPLAGPVIAAQAGTAAEIVALAKQGVYVIDYLFGKDSAEHWLKIGKVVLGVIALVAGAWILANSVSGGGAKRAAKGTAKKAAETTAAIVAA